MSSVFCEKAERFIGCNCFLFPRAKVPSEDGLTVSAFELDCWTFLTNFAPKDPEGSVCPTNCEPTGGHLLDVLQLVCERSKLLYKIVITLEVNRVVFAPRG